MSPAGHVLTVVLPAWNEEQAISDTLRRCIDAASGIQRDGHVAEVEWIVVSDGSTDRTAELARAFPGVTVVEFPENRGYGAAIKEGFRCGRGDLVAFLDADGTCDPACFARLCRVLDDASADLVVGTRLGPDSKMPRIRRIGNRGYALLLGFLCGRYITDTSSGMRVVRRAALQHLYPLPDGLHFTPAMSARAVLNGLRVVEVPIHYEERVGQSKLSVVRDGIRFLHAIVEGVVCYRPEALFLLVFVACMVGMLVLAAHPTEFYWQFGRLEEWMIYRFVACYLLGSFGLSLLLATALVHRMAHFSRRRTEANAFWPAIVSAMFRGWSLMLVFVLLTVAAGWFLWPGITEYATTRHIHLHWSRLLAGAFALFSVAQTAIYAVLMKIVAVWRNQ
jgi:glycosyltransferase involved in cell wall biosynthesis